MRGTLLQRSTRRRGSVHAGTDGTVGGPGGSALSGLVVSTGSPQARQNFGTLEFYGHSLTYGGSSDTGVRGSDGRLAALLPAEDLNRTKGGAILSRHEASPWSTVGNGGWAHIYRFVENDLAADEASGVAAYELAGGFEAKRAYAQLWFGNNDLPILGPGATNLTPFTNALRAVISRLRAAYIWEESDSAITYPTGTWSAGFASAEPAKWQSGSGFTQTTAAGGSVRLDVPASFPGGTIAMAFLCGADGSGAAWSFTVDGTAAGALEGRNVHSRSYLTGASGFVTPVVKRLTGLSAGAHTIIATTTAVNNNALFDCAWAESRTSPLIVVPSAIRPLAYTLWATWPYNAAAGLSDADVVQLNTLIQAVIAEFDSDVIYVDIDAAIAKTASYFTSDNTHLNDWGHAIVAATIAVQVAAQARSVAKHAAANIEPPGVSRNPWSTLRNIIQAVQPDQIPLSIWGRNAGDQSSHLLDLLSKGSAAYASLAIGRTADEAQLMVSAGANQGLFGSVAGDAVLRAVTAGKHLLVGVNTNPALILSDAGTITTSDPAHIPSIVQGAAAQVANLTEWRTSSSAVKALVAPDGAISTTSYLQASAGLDVTSTAITIGAGGGTGIGDKIALYGSGSAAFGVGVQTSRLVLAVPAANAVAVRASQGSGNVTSGSDAVTLSASGFVAALSNASGTFSYVSAGRTTAEAQLGAVAASNQFLTGAQPGDAILRAITSGASLWMGVNATPSTQINASGWTSLIQAVMTPSSASTIPAIIRAAASQSVDLLQLQDSTSAPLLNFTAAGKITQYEYGFSTWKTVPHMSVTGNPGSAGVNAAGTWVFYYGGIVALGAANSGICAFYVDPADFAAGSRTVKVRVRATLVTNAVAPGMNFTIGLYPVTTFAGASGANVTITAVGAATCSVTFTAPGASNGGAVAVSSAVTFPAAGFYCFAAVSSAAMAANSTVAMNAQLQYQQV